MKPKCCFGNNVDRMPEYLVDALRELQRDANRERHLLELDGDLDEYEIDICIAGFISTEAAMLVKDMTASLPPTSKAWCVAHNDWCPIFPHLCPGGHHFITAIAVLFEPATCLLNCPPSVNLHVSVPQSSRSRTAIRPCNSSLGYGTRRMITEKPFEHLTS